MKEKAQTWAKAKLPKIYKMIMYSFLSFLLNLSNTHCVPYRKDTHMEFMLNGNGDGSADLKKVDFNALEEQAAEGNI